MSVIVSDRRTLVVGLGKTGLSCVRYLSEQGRDIAVADTREAPPGLDQLQAAWPDIPVHLGRFDAELFAGFNELVVSPGISIEEPAIAAAAKQGARIRGDIDLFAEAADAPIVAITGSNGKTTVTTLLGEMAKAAGRNVAVGGNIGTPALDLLNKDADLYVLELSSFQLETTEELNAHAATVLNVSDDHMDRYPDKMAYFQAKQRIFRGCKNAIVNLDDALSTPMARDNLRFLCFGFYRVNPETFSTRDDNEGTWITFGFENLLLASELKVIGSHNISNVMAALALGHAVDLPMDVMLEVARRFPGLPHRCEFIRRLKDVDFINDSKGTNVGATVAAIESLTPEHGKTPNRALCVTNKLFHYPLAGLAVAATDVPGQRRMLEDHAAFGGLYEPGNPEGLASVLRRWRNCEALEEAKSRALETARTKWNWERESQKLVDQVIRVLDSERSASLEGSKGLG